MGMDRVRRARRAEMTQRVLVNLRVGGHAERAEG